MNKTFRAKQIPLFNSATMGESGAAKFKSVSSPAAEGEAGVNPEQDCSACVHAWHQMGLNHGNGHCYLFVKYQANCAKWERKQ